MVKAEENPGLNAETKGRSRFHIIVETLPFAITTVFKAGPFLTICLTLTTILSGLSPAATVYVGKLLLNAIVDVTQAGVTREKIHILIHIFIFQLLILVVSALLNQAGAYLNYFMGRSLSLNMKGRIIKRISKLDYTSFEDPNFYDMMTRAHRETDGKPMAIVYQVTSMVRGTITFISMSSLIISFSLPLFITTVIVCAPLLFIQLKYGEKNYWMQFKRTEDRRMADYTAGIMMSRQHAPEILNFRMWEYLFTKWNTASQRFFRQDVRLYRQRALADIITWTFVTCSTVGATGYIIYLNFAKSLSLTAGEIMMYSGAFAGSISALQLIIETISGIYENAIFLHDLVEFNKIKPHIEISRQIRPIPSQVESIELQNVSFKYPNSSVYTLNNINTIFKRSESALIIGANGAGKTTLIKLLTRLYDPTEGRILLNGIDIKEFEIQALRKTIGIIFQDFIQYAYSAKENIGCGSIENIQNTKNIIDAARRAKADSFLEQLPEQYETMLSKLFKNGQELSRGQWQRICLARMFMKNAPVFILDEPTANVDIETEAHLLGEIARLSKDKICIIASHRLFKRDICDKIVILRKGKIAETGSYDGLITKNGEFSRLWHLYHNITENEFTYS